MSKEFAEFLEEIILTKNPTFQHYYSNDNTRIMIKFSGGIWLEISVGFSMHLTSFAIKKKWFWKIHRLNSSVCLTQKTRDFIVDSGDTRYRAKKEIRDEEDVRMLQKLREALEQL